ncbi:MAG TPA: T9SS type A sorting domain-containing protein [Ignavibacteria bacterium]|nr:T9SS type A sorting domain-containing protein [Ignavibacteria bacterium]HMQ98160.1 T9SS type A sorting domain-containing protein [Ignavibacteria bacterium]
MNKNPQYSPKSSQKLKVLLYLILSFFFCQNATAQSITWQRTYKQYFYNYGFGACQTTDGNFVIVGQAVGSKLFAMKINPLGDTLWSIIQNDMPISLGLSVTPSDNGSVILTGGWNKAFVIKLNSNGIIEWNRTYANGTIDCNEIKKTNDGGFIFCGGFVYDSERAYVCKIDSLGNMLWQKVYSSNFHKAFRSIELAHDGGYIMTGEVQESSVTPGKILIFKINESGDSLWEKRFSFTNTSPGGIKIRKINNAYIIGGLTNDTNYRQQIFFANIKLNGDTNFVKTYPTYGRNEFFDDIAVINSNKYVICFDRDSSTVNYSSIAMITDSLGNILHKRFFTNTSYFIWGRLSTIVPISNGDILFTGTAKVTQPFGSEVVHAIRTDSLLNSPVIGISNENENTPSDFNLIQNFPNPFNPVTNIKFDIPKDVNVSIKIYDILGSEVFGVNEYKKAGSYEVKFDGSNLASGIYFYKIDTDRFSDTKKMVLLK